MKHFKSLFMALPLLFLMVAMAPVSNGEEEIACFCETSHEFETQQLNGCKVGITLQLSPQPSNWQAAPGTGCFVEEIEWFANGGATVVNVGSSNNIVALEAPGPGVYQVCAEVTVVGYDGTCTEYFCVNVEVDC